MSTTETNTGEAVIAASVARSALDGKKPLSSLFFSSRRFKIARVGTPYRASDRPPPRRPRPRAMGSDEDWFTRVRGLKPGEPANFVYARDFDANEVELLELPPDLLEKIQSGEESLSFKGAARRRGCAVHERPHVPRQARGDVKHPSRHATRRSIDRTVVGDAEGGTIASSIPPRTDPPQATRETPPRARHPHRERHHPRRHLRHPRRERHPALPNLTAYAGASSHLELVPTGQTGRDVARASFPARTRRGRRPRRGRRVGHLLDDTEFGEEGIPIPPRADSPRRTRPERARPGPS